MKVSMSWWVKDFLCVKQLRYIPRLYTKTVYIYMYIYIIPGPTNGLHELGGGMCSIYIGIVDGSGVCDGLPLAAYGTGLPELPP